MTTVKDDSHVSYYTIVVRRHGQEKAPIPEEYITERMIEVTNVPANVRHCRGRSVNRVVLLGLTVDDLPSDMAQALRNAQMTRAVHTGIEPSFIEVEPQHEPS